MANEKMTMRVFLENVIGGNLTDEVKEFAQGRLTALDEKNANRKVSKAQLEKQAKDAELRTRILNLMEVGKEYKASDVLALILAEWTETDERFSVNKIGAQLKKLAEGPEVAVDKSGKTCVYTKLGEVTTEDEDTF